MKIITVDLDSTLCDTRHRHSLVPAITGAPSWAEYSLACRNDTPIAATLMLVRLLATDSIQVHALTGRDAVARQATEEWLKKYDIPITDIWMDESGDHTTEYGGHAEYKLGRIKEIEATTGLKVILHIDDWAPVRNLLEANGYSCLCVKPPHEWGDQSLGALL